MKNVMCSLFELYNHNLGSSSGCNYVAYNADLGFYLTISVYFFSCQPLWVAKDLWSCKVLKIFKIFWKLVSWLKYFIAYHIFRKTTWSSWTSHILPPQRPIWWSFGIWWNTFRYYWKFLFNVWVWKIYSKKQA